MKNSSRCFAENQNAHQLADQSLAKHMKLDFLVVAAPTGAIFWQ
jgi:hypothetical protein